MRTTTTTIIAFYQGAYGPTIRIDVQDIEWLKLFQKTLIHLLQKDIWEFDLLNLGNVEKDDISGLKLVLGVSSDLSMVSTVRYEKYPTFTWVMDVEDIDRTIGAIECYLDRNKSGHHYLYEGQIVVELAYREDT